MLETPATWAGVERNRPLEAGPRRARHSGAALSERPRLPQGPSR